MGTRMAMPLPAPPTTRMAHHNRILRQEADPHPPQTLYKVEVKVSFDLAKFPFDSQSLKIALDPAARESRESVFAYTPDVNDDCIYGVQQGLHISTSKMNNKLVTDKLVSGFRIKAVNTGPFLYRMIDKVLMTDTGLSAGSTLFNESIFQEFTYTQVCSDLSGSFFVSVCCV